MRSGIVPLVITKVKNCQPQKSIYKMFCLCGELNSTWLEIINDYTVFLCVILLYMLDICILEKQSH